MWLNAVHSLQSSSRLTCWLIAKVDFLTCCKQDQIIFPDEAMFEKVSSIYNFVSFFFVG